MKLAEAPGWVWQVHTVNHPVQVRGRFSGRSCTPLQRDAPPLFGQEIIRRQEDLVKDVCHCLPQSRDLCCKHLAQIRGLRMIKTC